MIDVRFEIAKIAMQNLSATTDKVGTVGGKTYKYASLNAVQATLVEPLKETGLTYFQSVERVDNIPTIVTTVFGVGTDVTPFVSETVIPLAFGVDNIHQAMGAGITYFRRYCLATLFNVHMEDDTDAEGVHKKKIILKDPTSKEFKGVIKRLKAGASMRDIKTEYVITEAVEAILTKNSF